MINELYNNQYLRSANKLSFEFCLFENKIGKIDLLKNKFKNYKFKLKRIN